MIPTISNTLGGLCQHSIYSSLVTHCYSKTISLLSPSSSQAIHIIQAHAKRIHVAALVIFGALMVACCLFFSYRVIMSKQASPSTTLTTEFSAAKQELLENRRMLEKESVDLEHACAAKIFLILIHDTQCLTKTHIITNIPHQIWTHKQIKNDLITQIDSLVDELQNELEFHDQHKTEFRIGILFKDAPEDPMVDELLKNEDIPIEIKNQYTSPQTFSRIIGEVTTYKGKRSNASSEFANRVTLTDQIQQDFCDALSIPFHPQIDASGQFV